ncbi:probable pseudouridine-5'-phosphatase isoform X3 [Zeugodacus cucurbitae]|uniref:pseudouridine 5'-phosphatase n=1 Tax=Zeugodacus cucurbitae TaxID=28588 RepID=A0A0A1WZY1_ZEUCU|nr:probable pseudouridine-5'-phosphatase isoform X3 [Zeugodacus cucurbitae]
MCTKFKNVTHCIFDMDGLLLDTEKLYSQATQEILDPYGKTYTWDVKVSVMGLQTQQVAEAIVDAYKLPISWEEYAQKQRDRTEILMTEAELMPGAERLLRHLHANNIPIALATSSGEHMVEIKITKHRYVFGLFHHRVCGSTDQEVKEGKPSPDIFLIAASRFPDKPDPSKCLVFEDAPNGVQAALSAGMQVVMVPDELVTDELRKGATQVLHSLEDFCPEKFGLPPFPKSC